MFSPPFLSVFSSPSLGGLLHLGFTLVDHPNPYLSTCPIRHPYQFFVSCSDQGNTVQRSSFHYCGRESSCGAFNVVVAAFVEIFQVSFLFTCLEGGLQQLGRTFDLDFGMSEEELLLGHVLFHPVGLNKDSEPRRLLRQTGPRTGPGPS